MRHDKAKSRFFARKAVENSRARLRELEREQAELRARIDLLGRALASGVPGLAPRDEAALRRGEAELRLLAAAAAKRIRDFRKACWLAVAVQLCLLAAMLAAFCWLLPTV